MTAAEIEADFGFDAVKNAAKKAVNKAKKAALKKVDAFIDGATDGRDPKDVEVIIIEPCGEPMAFKTNFPEWEDEVSQ